MFLSSLPKEYPPCISLYPDAEPVYLKGNPGWSLCSIAFIELGIVTLLLAIVRGVKEVVIIGFKYPFPDNKLPPS